MSNPKFVVKVYFKQYKGEFPFLNRPASLQTGVAFDDDDVKFYKERYSPKSILESRNLCSQNGGNH